MKRTTIGLLGLLMIASSSPAAAAAAELPAAAVTAAPEVGSLVLGARVGLAAPQLFSGLDSFAVFEAELGYLLPVWERRLQLAGSFAYTQPPASGAASDRRLASGYAYDVTQREYVFELALLVRAFPPERRVVPYGKVGMRLYLLDTDVGGQVGTASFGRYSERFVEPGFVLGGGLDVRLGPGAFHAELRIDYSNMNRTLSGGSSAGMLTLAVGYRFFL